MSKSSQYLTKKQYQILTVLCDGNGDDACGNFSPADLDELLDRSTLVSNLGIDLFDLRKNKFWL